MIRLTASIAAVAASQFALVGKVINAKQRKPSPGASGAEVMKEASDCIHPAETPSNLSRNIVARLIARDAHGKRTGPKLTTCVEEKIYTYAPK